MSPTADMAFFVREKVGSAIVEDYTQTCERRNREIENAYIRAQRLPDDRLIYCFRTSGGAEKLVMPESWNTGIICIWTVMAYIRLLISTKFQVLRNSTHSPTSKSIFAAKGIDLWTLTA